MCILIYFLKGFFLRVTLSVLFEYILEIARYTIAEYYIRRTELLCYILGRVKSLSRSVLHLSDFFNNSRTSAKYKLLISICSLPLSFSSRASSIIYFLTPLMINWSTNGYVSFQVFIKFWGTFDISKSICTNFFLFF